MDLNLSFSLNRTPNCSDHRYIFLHFHGIFIAFSWHFRLFSDTQILCCDSNWPPEGILWEPWERAIKKGWSAQLQRWPYWDGWKLYRLFVVSKADVYWNWCKLMYLFHAFPRFISLFSCLCQTVQCLETRSYQLPYRPKDRVGSPLEWPDVFVLSNSEWKSKNFGQNSHWVVTWWTSDPSVTSGALLQFRILKTDLRVVPIVHTLYTRLWIVTCRKDQQRLVYSRICDSRKRKRQDVNREKKNRLPIQPGAWHDPNVRPFHHGAILIPTFSPTVPTVLTFSPTPRFDVVSSVVVSDIERPRLSRRSAFTAQFLPQKKQPRDFWCPDLISITAVFR